MHSYAVILDTGLGSTKPNPDFQGDIWVHYHPFKDFSSSQDKGPGASTSARLSKHLEEDDFDPKGIPLWHQDSMRSP
ncbi:hypothetical protein SLEP1_g40907 [Rubroshorea leprosula]|uniref:Uncharacterized protein n=1 Tax=Rubroshorea leprosula TaxID=152421 RepID=A0AAV5L5A6_9ROSI|nr:hypothetical protein SLEP1_g40907 [Rubroshorea leprosula]